MGGNSLLSATNTEHFYKTLPVPALPSRANFLRFAPDFRVENVILNWELLIDLNLDLDPSVLFPTKVIPVFPLPILKIFSFPDLYSRFLFVVMYDFGLLHVLRSSQTSLKTSAPLHLRSSKHVSSQSSPRFLLVFVQRPFLRSHWFAMSRALTASQSLTLHWLSPSRLVRLSSTSFDLYLAKAHIYFVEQSQSSADLAILVTFRERISSCILELMESSCGSFCLKSFLLTQQITFSIID